MAASHKYEQVNTNLQEKDLGDGLSGKTFEAEAKARRILADDAEDLWTGLEKAGNDLKDASTTVTTINNAAHNLAARVKEDDLIISKNGEITTDPQSVPSVDPSQQLSLIEDTRGSVTDLSNKRATQWPSSLLYTTNLLNWTIRQTARAPRWSTTAKDPRTPSGHPVRSTTGGPH